MALYRKVGTTEMIPWDETIDMEGVSISKTDIDLGSPKKGDMIACSPINPNDRWLIEVQYFNNMYEEAK